jgi:hypothetical protein
VRQAKAKAFAKEADLCAAFISALPKDWIAYPEWSGFDILLVGPGGIQVGVEAKLVLNARVIEQALESSSSYRQTTPGPDFRAVLVPSGCSGGLEGICRRLGVTVIRCGPSGGVYQDQRIGFRPYLPDGRQDDGWWDYWPWTRIPLPEIVPDCAAGTPSPVRLTAWKMKAIKVAILISKRGFVTRHDFKVIGIDHRRWVEAGWLAYGDNRGCYVAGNMPDFRAQHPRNYDEIEAKADIWMPLALDPPQQAALL